MGSEKWASYSTSALGNKILDWFYCSDQHIVFLNIETMWALQPRALNMGNEFEIKLAFILEAVYKVSNWQDVKLTKRSGSVLTMGLFFLVSTLSLWPSLRWMGFSLRQSLTDFSSSKTTKPKLGTLWPEAVVLDWVTPLLLIRTSDTWKNCGFDRHPANTT